MSSPGDAAPAVDRHDLTGDVGRIGCEKQRRARDVECRAAALEQGPPDDFLLEVRIGDTIGGPHDRPGCDGVDANLRSEFAGKGSCEHDEAGFRHSVDGIATQRTQTVDIDDVQDESLRKSQGGRRSLRKKKRRFQVGAEQIVPVRCSDFADRRRIEGRGVVDEDVESSELLFSEPRQLAEFRRVEKIEADAGCTLRTLSVELCDQGFRLFGRALVMNDQIGTGIMEHARDLGTDATRTARDERDLPCEWSIRPQWILGARLGFHGSDYDATRESLNAERR